MIEVLYTFLILGGLGLVLGIALAISSVIFYVKEDTRVEDIKNMLPNYNCGACATPVAIATDANKAIPHGII